MLKLLLCCFWDQCFVHSIVLSRSLTIFINSSRISNSQTNKNLFEFDSGIRKNMASEKSISNIALNYSEDKIINGFYVTVH